MESKTVDMFDFYKAPVAGNGRRNCNDPLTMVFINVQPLDGVYTLCDGFCNGTLFPNLNKPFSGGVSNGR